MPLDDNYEPHIPAAVRRASARADAIAREIGAANVPEDKPEENLTEQPVEQPVETSAAPENTETAPETTAPVVDKPVEDWEQRYKTLQGKYDAEIGQIGQLRNQVSSLQNLLGQLQSAEPAAPAQPVVQPGGSIPEKDITDFGEDLVAAARRWAMVEISPHIETLKREIAELRSGHSTIEQKTSQQLVMSALDADSELAGKWRDINNQPEFLTWLRQVDPFSGRQRMELLQGAFASGDAVRTGNFFKAFMTEHTAVTSPPAAAPAQTPANGAGGPQLQLENLAAPGRAAGQTQGGAPAEKRIWTNREISAFYRDCAQGKYNTREADKRALELDIFAAAAEGRVRN